MDHTLKKVLRLSSDDYYTTHLNLMNCILPVKMTPREIEVMAAFMSLEGDIALYRFGPSAKKIVMKRLNLSPAGLSNFMGTLLGKGFLIQKGDAITIYPMLNLQPNEQIYMFKLINYNETNHEQITTTAHTA